MDLLQETLFDPERLRQVRAGYDRRAEQGDLPCVFRERFLARLGEPERNAMRLVGELLWGLAAEPSEELRGNRPGSAIRSEARALLAELRYTESLCPRFAGWSLDPRCRRADAEVAQAVDSLGLLLAAAGDILEQRLGARPARRPER